MRYHFVVNPVAGRRAALPLAERVRVLLHEAGAETTCYVTTEAGDASRHVAGLAPAALDRLVVVGGDGTLREVVNAQAEPPPWPVGLVPMGTANLVARELRMPRGRNARRLAARLLASEAWRVDLLRITRPSGAAEFALANLGAGLDAEIVHATSEVRAEAVGLGAGSAGGYARWAAPIWGAVRDFRFPRMRVTVDGRRSYAAAACIVQNAHNYGGVFRLSREAALDTGRLEVTLIRARTKRDLVRVLAGALARRIDTFSDVKIVTGARVSLRCARPVKLQADGDPAGTTDADIALLPGAMRLLRG